MATRIELSRLSARRAKDRELIAQHIVALAGECGAEVVERDETSREIMLLVRGGGGLQVRVSLDGTDRNPDFHLLSWNIHYGSKAQLNDATFGGNVNPYHKQKATYLAEGTHELDAQLRRGFMLAASGDAFLAGV